jgi:hypothetical protein
MALQSRSSTSPFGVLKRSPHEFAGGFRRHGVAAVLPPPGVAAVCFALVSEGQRIMKACGTRHQAP